MSFLFFRITHFRMQELVVISLITILMSELEFVAKTENERHVPGAPRNMVWLVVRGLFVCICLVALIVFHNFIWHVQATERIVGLVISAGRLVAIALGFVCSRLESIGDVVLSNAAVHLLVAVTLPVGPKPAIPFSPLYETTGGTVSQEQLFLPGADDDQSAEQTFATRLQQ
jgi:hypothetical protein